MTLLDGNALRMRVLGSGVTSPVIYIHQTLGVALVKPHEVRLMQIAEVRFPAFFVILDKIERKTV